MYRTERCSETSIRVSVTSGTYSDSGVSAADPSFPSAVGAGVSAGSCDEGSELLIETIVSADRW
ncbi:hypothetical protein K8P10_002464 [Leucobacter sp. Psy1]|nr:hypothetical protein K8P10_002464 [Leucobacter sp. Psy1]